MEALSFLLPYLSGTVVGFVFALYIMRREIAVGHLAIKFYRENYDATSDNPR